jgi:hypothetical protein
VWFFFLLRLCERLEMLPVLRGLGNEVVADEALYSVGDGGGTHDSDAGAKRGALKDPRH